MGEEREPGHWSERVRRSARVVKDVADAVFAVTKAAGPIVGGIIFLAGKLFDSDEPPAKCEQCGSSPCSCATGPKTKKKR